jgi:hypothetical protein
MPLSVKINISQVIAKIKQTIFLELDEYCIACILNLNVTILIEIIYIDNKVCVNVALIFHNMFSNYLHDRLEFVYLINTIF